MDSNENMNKKECSYAGHMYPDGSQVLMGEKQWRCRDGEWVLERE